MSEEKKKVEGGAETAAAGGAEKTTQKKSPSNTVRAEKKKSPWTLERCVKAAHRFTNPTEWADGAPSSFKAATAHGWVAQCTSHMGGRGATPIAAGKRPAPTKPTHKKSA